MKGLVLMKAVLVMGPHESNVSLISTYNLSNGK